MHLLKMRICCYLTVGFGGKPLSQAELSPGDASGCSECAPRDGLTPYFNMLLLLNITILVSIYNIIININLYRASLACIDKRLA